MMIAQGGVGQRRVACCAARSHPWLQAGPGPVPDEGAGDAPLYGQTGDALGQVLPDGTLGQG